MKRPDFLKATSAATTVAMTAPYLRSARLRGGLRRPGAALHEGPHFGGAEPRQRRGAREAGRTAGRAAQPDRLGADDAGIARGDARAPCRLPATPATRARCGDRFERLMSPQLGYRRPRKRGARATAKMLASSDFPLARG